MRLRKPVEEDDRGTVAGDGDVEVDSFGAG
jgi:hypothetical protein